MDPITPSRLRTPEEIALRAGIELPRLLLPKPESVFSERAVRLRQLAAGHPMRDYLLLIAVVCEAQHDRLQSHPAIALPDAEQAEIAAQRGEPLLGTERWPRDPVWRSELRALLRLVLDRLPADNPARAGVQAAIDLPDDRLEQQVGRLLAGITIGLDMAIAPLIAAGLQLHWTHLVAATGAALSEPFGLVRDPSRCPCCGSLPTASLTRVGGDQEGYRYLHCALCSAQWHMVRVKCTHCESTAGIQYQALQALADPKQPTRREPVQAETCDGCHHYLKILHMERDLQVEPIADDLASLTLDLLVADAGYQRHGTNLLLLFGDDDGDPPPGPA